MKGSISRRIFVLVAIGALLVEGGVSWKAIWLDPFELHLKQDEMRAYKVSGIRLDDVQV